MVKADPTLARRVAQYQIVGRAAPTQKVPVPKIFRMKVRKGSEGCEGTFLCSIVRPGNGRAGRCKSLLRRNFEAHGRPKTFRTVGGEARLRFCTRRRKRCKRRAWWLFGERESCQRPEQTFRLRTDQGYLKGVR